MTRTTITGNPGFTSLTSDQLDNTPEAGVIASSDTGIVFFDTYGALPQIYQRNGLRSGDWASHTLNPVIHVGPPGTTSGPLAIVSISTGCYDASTLGARPDRIRLVWQPSSEIVPIFLDEAYTLPGLPPLQTSSGVNYRLQSWTGTAGPLDVHDGIRDVGDLSHNIPSFTLHLRGEPNAITVLNRGDHNVASGGGLFEDNQSYANSSVGIPGRSAGLSLRGYTAVTGAVAGSGSDIRVLWLTVPYDFIGGFPRTLGSLTLAGGDEPLSFGVADLPYHADMIAAGNGTTAQTLFVAVGTTNGIALSSLSPGSSDRTEHVTISWPQGYSIANLKGIYLTHFQEGSIGVLAVWGTTTTFALRGHVFHPNLNTLDPDGWLDVATESFSVYTPRPWIDRYPRDKTFRFAAKAVNTAYCWEHHVNDPPDQPEITTESGPLSVSAQMSIDWIFSDGDFLDTQSAYQIRQVVDDGDPQYWLGTSGSWSSTASPATKHAGMASSAQINGSIPASRIGEVTDVSVRVWDQGDAVSQWSNPVRFSRAGIPLINSFITPTDNSTITSLPLTVSWIPRLGQGSYRLRAYTGTGRNQVTHFDTGRIYSAASSATIVIPNGLTQSLGLTLYTTDDVPSTGEVSVRVTIDLPVPGPGSIRAAASYNSALPNIDLNYYSTEPGNLELYGVDIYRRLAGDTGPGIRVAADLPIPDDWTAGEDWTDYTAAHSANYDYRAAIKTEYSERLGAWNRINNLVEE